MFFVSIFHSRTKSKSWKTVDRSITSFPNDAGNLCPFQSQIFHTAEIRRRKIGSLLFVREKRNEQSTTKKESKLRIAFGFVLIVRMAKRFKMLINIVRKKSTKILAYSQTQFAALCV